MEITLKFDSVEEFFEQLPRFAALMNFSGQFAEFKAKPKDDAGTRIEDPDLPTIERSPDKLTIHADSVKGKTKEEVGDLINKAYDTAEAIGATTQPEQPSATPEPTEPEQKPWESAKSEKPSVKITDVRKALSDLIKSGKRDTVKEILESFGVEGVSGLKPEQYGDVLKKAREAQGDG